MSRNEIIQDLNEILEVEFEVPPDLLVPESLLGEDLELDSLDAVDLIVAIEKKFGCRIEEEKARQMKALKDIYDAIDVELAA